MQHIKINYSFLKYYQCLNIIFWQNKYQFSRKFDIRNKFWLYRFDKRNLEIPFTKYTSSTITIQLRFVSKLSPQIWQVSTLLWCFKQFIKNIGSLKLSYQTGPPLRLVMCCLVWDSSNWLVVKVKPLHTVQCTPASVRRSVQTHKLDNSLSHWSHGSYKPLSENVFSRHTFKIV